MSFWRIPVESNPTSKNIHQVINLKKPKTISIDADILDACTDQPAGFASGICNQALRAAMFPADAGAQESIQPQIQDIPEGDVGLAHQEALTRVPRRVYVPSYGWVRVPDGVQCQYPTRQF